MQNFNNETPKKIYGEIKEHKDGIFTRFFKNIFTGCLTCGCITLIVLVSLISLAVWLFSGDCGIKNCTGILQNDSGNLFTEEYVTGLRAASERIAVIPVKGIILRDENASFNTCAVSGNIIKQLQQALEDESVKAVIMDLDTPGGEVTASDEIWKKILDVRKKKPVVAMMNTLCASGGYYIAAGCSPIVANKYTLTGSIGVIISTWNYKGLFDKIGLKPEVYTSGKMKDMLNGARERTAEETILVQTLVNNAYEGFVNIVAAARNIPAEKVKNTIIGDGRIFDGKQAFALKLVDKLGYFEDAVKTAAEAAKLKEYQVFRYENKFDFGRFCTILTGKTAGFSLALPGAETMENGVRLKKGVLYYLPAGY